MRKKTVISKRTGITAILGIALILALIIIFHQNPLADRQEEVIKKIMSCMFIVIVLTIFIVTYDKITILPTELFQNRKLIWRLSKNDFKTRYAGSYLGIVWAFVQPVVTTFMYWFVFEKFMGAKAEIFAGGIEAPYVIYLTAGLVPWFFFSEALVNGTTALIEYNYLVKKIVFKISILPMIKIIAALFIHVFFVCFLLVFAGLVYGIAPTVYTLQLIYYSLCMFILVLGISYATCSIVIFFRDLNQIISICLQVGMWGTPILWSLSHISEKYHMIFKLNPIYYVVNGYRSALFQHTWFWEDFYSTMYFWIVTVLIFGLGALIFKRLKVHFADVL